MKNIGEKTNMSQGDDVKFHLHCCFGIVYSPGDHLDY